MTSEDEDVEKEPTIKRPLVAVTGSQQPYVFDLPQLLSLPMGFEFRFRYRHSWIEKDVRDALRYPANLTERDVVIIFHSQDSQTIIPIRLAKIISVEVLGPMVLVRFRVQQFAQIDLDLVGYRYPVEPNKPDDGAAQAISTLSQRAHAYLGPIRDSNTTQAEPNSTEWDLSRPLPRGWYLRESVRPIEEAEWDQREDASEAWARVVAVLQSEKNLFGVPFFHLLGFRNEVGETVSPKAIEKWFSPGHEPIHAFRLNEAERYRMRVLEWCERPLTAPAPRIKLSVEYDKTSLVLEGSSNLVVGRYDVVEHTFVAQRAGYSELALRAESIDEKKPRPTGDDLKLEAGRTEAKSQESTPPAPKERKGDEQEWPWTSWPAIFVARVPVIVKAKRTRFLVAALFLAAGFAMYVWGAPRFDEGSTGRRLFELLSLGVMFLGYKPVLEPVERFLKLEESTKKMLDKTLEKKS